jgi:hypothetical protein
MSLKEVGVWQSEQLEEREPECTSMWQVPHSSGDAAAFSK